MRDESSAETRAALRGEQNRGAKAQMCRGAKAKTGRVSCRERKRNTRWNAGEKSSYIGSARARSDRSHAHTNRDAHLACF